MRRFLFLVTLTILSCVPAYSSAKAQDNQLLSLLTKKNKQINDAIIQGDLAPVHQLFSSSAIVINPVGGLATYDGLAAVIKSGTLKYTALNVSEAKLTQFGDIAVLVFLSDESGTMQGHDISAKIRRTEVWTQRDGQWQIVMAQPTPVLARP